jgi:hypothetical protein
LLAQAESKSLREQYASLQEQQGLLLWAELAALLPYKSGLYMRLII